MLTFSTFAPSTRNKPLMFVGFGRTGKGTVPTNPNLPIEFTVMSEHLPVADLGSGPLNKVAFRALIPADQFSDCVNTLLSFARKWLPERNAGTFRTASGTTPTDEQILGAILATLSHYNFLPLPPSEQPAYWAPGTQPPTAAGTPRSGASTAESFLNSVMNPQS
jgi:hypothetical protein